MALSQVHLNLTVTVPNSASFSMTNAVTVCLWFDVFGTLNGPQCILDKAWKQPAYHDWTYRSWSTWFSDYVSFAGSTNGAPSGGANDAVSIGPVSYNNWHHILGRRRGAGLWLAYSQPNSSTCGTLLRHSCQVRFYRIFQPACRLCQ